MKKRTRIILISILVGMGIIFFAPVFPVPLPNMNGVYLIPEGLWWKSGLSVINSLKNFILIEVIGGIVGFLIPFTYFTIKGIETPKT